MRILLVGASGMIGSRVLAEAASRGHQVTAVARRPERIATGPNVRAISLDATDSKALAAQARDADVIVTATSPRGGAGSLNLPDGRPLAETLPDAYRPEALAMRGVLNSLKASDIDWTFFSPAAMISPGTKTGVYRLGTTTLLSNDKGESRISAEDYADALVNELEQPAHRRGQMTIAY